MIRLNILIPSGYLSITSPRTYNVSSGWRLICFIMDSNLRRFPWMSDNTYIIDANKSQADILKEILYNLDLVRGNENE